MTGPTALRPRTIGASTAATSADDAPETSAGTSGVESTAGGSTQSDTGTTSEGTSAEASSSGTESADTGIIECGGLGVSASACEALEGCTATMARLISEDCQCGGAMSACFLLEPNPDTVGGRWYDADSLVIELRQTALAIEGWSPCCTDPDCPARILDEQPASCVCPAC